MATTPTTRSAPVAEPVDLDAMIEQDPHKPGRHHARVAETGTHVWAIVGGLRRTGGDVRAVAREWALPESTVRAAERYYERHRALFEALFLLQDEELRSRDADPA